MIPTPTWRAFRIAQHHRAVRDVRLVEDTDEGGVAIELDVETELPSAWRVAGVSPSGVRELETIRVEFPSNYPLGSPWAFLREDFDRSHPHLLPGPDALPPRPCIVQGLPNELIQARGFEGYLDQLADWLDKAAMLELNNPEHGWEPVRRNHLDDELMFDRDAVTGLATAAGGCVATRTAFVKIEGAGDHKLIRFLLDLSARPDLQNVACTVTPTRDGVTRGSGLALILSAPDVNGEPFVVDQTMPETVTDVASLLERADRYGCRAALDGKLAMIGIRLPPKKGSLTPTPLVVVFLVRRPFNVKGTQSPIELCAYVLDLKADEELLHGRGAVRLCGLREEVSPALMRRAAGENETGERRPWSLLGCGSVGSKIAVHLARRGRGPSLVADHYLMSPHNYARHALLPSPAEHADYLESKPHLLAAALTGFKQPAAIETGDIVRVSATPEGRAKLGGSGFVLNTTGSSLVREALSHQTWEQRPQIGEAHLLGGGAAAYSAFEGADGNPGASDLAAESYRLIAEEPELSSKVFGAEAEAIEIGQGCSTVSFAMPDDRLSALTGGLSETVARRLRGDSEGDGEINIGRLAADGLSQSWSRHAVAPWIALRGDGGHEVRISARVDEAIRRSIAERPGVETGGVIVGRYSQIGETFQVVDVMPAPPDSTFSAARFTLGVLGLRPAIQRLRRLTGGSLHVIGTWHNHLVPSGPSILDAATAARLALRQAFPVLLLIAHSEGYSCLTAETAPPDQESYTKLEAQA